MATSPADDLSSGTSSLPSRATSMARTLVAYYSRTGHTRDVAGEIASIIGTDVDIEEILEESDRPGALGWIRCAFEAMFRLRPALRAGRDVHGYDVVFVGGPIWMGRLAPAVRAFVEQHIGRETRVAYFATQEGAPTDAAWHDLEALSPARPVACHSIRNGAVPQAVRRAELERFVARAQRGQPATADERATSASSSRHAHG
ncbi:flavodoxin family protein [Cognatilysobacter lacus]|uniref:Flavodoxin-like domain-containing protein n=1 Tax=Cognatilysobacter lacus TaxID=1643323 RepID=A0A5D8YNM3_9GAMM|nr:flavodoxin [Lysobacter lacus]TZF84201.1 hypothetical protein FW784_12820 [Lysobacter lacus]